MKKSLRIRVGKRSVAQTHRLLVKECDEDVQGLGFQFQRLARHVLVALGHQIEALSERNRRERTT